MKHKLKHGEQMEEVLALRAAPGRYRTNFSSGAELLLSDVEYKDDRLSFTLDCTEHQYDVLLLPDSVVLCDGDNYYEVQRDSGVAAAAQSTGDEELTSRMPGKLLLHHVAAGDRVEKGRPLLILEAMKMEHEVVAPASGLVEALLFEPGQRVMPGDLLLRFVPDAAAGEG